MSSFWGFVQSLVPEYGNLFWLYFQAVLFFCCFKWTQEHGIMAYCHQPSMSVLRPTLLYILNFYLSELMFAPLGDLLQVSCVYIPMETGTGHNGLLPSTFHVRPRYTLPLFCSFLFPGLLSFSVFKENDDILVEKCF